MTNTLRAALLSLVMIATAAGCGALDDARRTSDTVDRTVELLNEIQQHGSWDRLAEGLDNLAHQTVGYRATIRIQRGIVDSAGAFAGPPHEETTIELQVDSQRAFLADVIQPAGRRSFYGAPAAHPAHATDLYAVASGLYTCANQDEPFLRAGLDGIFEQYAVSATSVQVLAVARAHDEQAVTAGRDATHYTLESMVPAALAILEDSGSTVLLSRLDQTGGVALSGDLYLDQATGALLAFTSSTTQQPDKLLTQFAFEVTQWDGVPMIAQPDPADIAEPCGLD